MLDPKPLAVALWFPKMVKETVVSNFHKVWFEERAIVFVTLSFLALSVISWAKWGDIAYDTGHELEITTRILNGQVLYRDVQTPYSYGPLSYYVNAFLLSAFGNRIETFYCAGLFSSLLLLVLVHQLFQPWVAKPLAELVVFVVLVHCIFEKALGNFIFPYTYAATYAQVLGIAQLYVLVQQRSWSPLAGGGLAALALLSKPEFGVAALGAGLVYQSGRLWGKRVGVAGWLQCWSIYLAGFITTIGVCLLPLLSQIELNTFLDNAFPFQRLAIIQRTILAQVSFAHTLEIWGRTGLFFCIVSLVILVGIYLQRYIGVGLSLFATVGLLGLAYALGIRGQDLLPLRNLHGLFLIFPLLLFFPAVRLALGQKIEVLLMALYLYIFAVLLNLRALLDIPLFYPINGLSLILLFCLLTGVWYRNAWFYLGVCGVTTTLGLIQYYSQPTYAIQGPRGAVKTHDFMLGQTYQSTLDFLAKVPKKDRQQILVLPDGALLNYLSGTHAPVPQTFFNPLILANAGEEKQWLQQLRYNLPAYVVIVNPPHNQPGNLASFNPVVNQWIRCQHVSLTSFGEPPLVEIFERKPQSLSLCR